MNNIKLHKGFKEVREGDTWSINDKLTKGHKSTITKVKDDEVEHIPRTHADKTRNRSNIQLQENPESDDMEDCFILSKIQSANRKKLGKKHLNQDIKNPIDKSIIRHMKKEHKKRWDGQGSA